MGKTWFRVHADGPSSITRNRKLQTLPPPLFKWLVNFWAFACRNDGCLPPVEDIAWEFRVSVPSVSKVVQELVTKGFLEQVDGVFVIHDWSDHQFETDHSTERVRKFRERKRNASSVSSTVSPPFHETVGNGSRNASRSRARSESESESVSVSGSVSESESVSVVSSESGTEKTSVLVTAARSDAWERYISVFLVGGKKLNDKDMQKALQQWLSFSVEEQIAAFESAKEIATTRESQYIPFPFNHLMDKPWTRKGPGRLIPNPPKNAREASQLEAERLFDERRKTK